MTEPLNKLAETIERAWARNGEVPFPLYRGEAAAMARDIQEAIPLRGILLELLAVIDGEIEQRKNSGNDEDWKELEALSDRAHAAARCEVVEARPLPRPD